MAVDGSMFNVLVSVKGDNEDVWLSDVTRDDLDTFLKTMAGIVNGLLAIKGTNSDDEEVRVVFAADCIVYVQIFPTAAGAEASL